MILELRTPESDCKAWIRNKLPNHDKLQQVEIRSKTELFLLPRGLKGAEVGEDVGQRQFPRLLTPMTHDVRKVWNISDD